MIRYSALQQRPRKFGSECADFTYFDAVETLFAKLQVDLTVASQPAPEIIQVRQEQRRVAPLLRLPLGEEDLPGPPVDRTGQVALLIIARRLDLRLLALEHPHRADLGVGVDIHLILEDGRLVLGQFVQELAQGIQLGLTLRVLRPQHRTWSAVDHAATVEPAPDRLAADLDVVDLEHQEDDRLAAPAAPEEAELARGVFADPVENDLDPGGIEAKGAAPLLAAQGLDPLLLIPLDPTVDRARATEEDGGDGGPGVSVGQEQEDVGAEADLGIAVLAVAVE
jgi:hypothetical protein